MELWRRLRGRIPSSWKTRTKAWTEALIRRVPALSSLRAKLIIPYVFLTLIIAGTLICYHLLLQENTNFGLSIGRLDQTLNPFYLSDWNKLTDDVSRAAYTRRAVELMCHFFLRCSDHVPLSPESAEVLFAGSGSNQALTVGGTRYENGQTVDAVNDMTYIILKLTEMLSLIDQVLREVVDEGFTQEEVDAAGDYLHGSLPLHLTNPRAVLRYVERGLRAGLSVGALEDDWQAIRSTPLSAVNEAARRLIGDGEFRLAVIGPARDVRPQIEGRGEIAQFPFRASPDRWPD